MPRFIVSLEAQLRRVLDLTNGEARRLSEPWRRANKQGREARAQAIGRLAYEAGWIRPFRKAWPAFGRNISRSIELRRNARLRPLPAVLRRQKRGSLSPYPV